MYLQVKTFLVENEHLTDIVKKWTTDRRQDIDGIVSVKVYVDEKHYRDEREVMVQILWESKEKCKAWRTHPDHAASHKKNKERPQWILKVENKEYSLVE